MTTCPRCGSDRREQFNDGPGLMFGGCFDPEKMEPAADPWHTDDPYLRNVTASMEAFLAMERAGLEEDE